MISVAHDEPLESGDSPHAAPVTRESAIRTQVEKGSVATRLGRQLGGNPLEDHSIAHQERASGKHERHDHPVRVTKGRPLDPV